jgi:hypothetical protein
MEKAIATIALVLLASLGVWGIAVLVHFIQTENKKNEEHYERVRRRNRELFSRQRHILRPERDWSEAREVPPTQIRVRRRGRTLRSVSRTKPSAARSVTRQSRTLLQSRGWRTRGSIREGYYRTRYGSYPGRIECPYAGHWRYFITNPPEYLKNHNHYCCFFPRGENRYEIHFEIMPSNAADGIAYIEQVLIEAHEGRNCRK